MARTRRAWDWGVELRDEERSESASESAVDLRGRARYPEPLSTSCPCDNGYHRGQEEQEGERPECSLSFSDPDYDGGQTRERQGRSDDSFH
jgi:hypothetical protein